MLGGRSKIDGLEVYLGYGRHARDVNVKVEKVGSAVKDVWFDCMYRCVKRLMKRMMILHIACLHSGHFVVVVHLLVQPNAFPFEPGSLRPTFSSHAVVCSYLS